ncbi:N-acylneuraminate cytidylyltransferase-like [Lucilia cuprina]|uniref:N-acylneuraminate cytidylyltransferase-like n=1 Tax=Lucilia cuprina TaxID=7375 RepID=UPI001F068292|nr:N-acylneuraminate cytidylyltransferase-like [Lucilia cuprina]
MDIFKSSLNDTHAIILARGGSKGIKNKNLLQFNGNSILGTTIKTIKKSGMFENIWVSTDSDVIEMEALKPRKLYRKCLSSKRKRLINKVKNST